MVVEIARVCRIQIRGLAVGVAVAFAKTGVVGIGLARNVEFDELFAEEVAEALGIADLPSGFCD